MTILEKANEQRMLLEGLGFSTGSKECAIDLGCGSGFQSIALSDLGYESVIALDTSQALLKELSAASQGRLIRTVHADLRGFTVHVDNGNVDAIVCMGDTITHLESADDVSKLFQDAYHTLRRDGRIALTFRDFSNELTGTDRFIPVWSDNKRIMLCALFYEPENVVVTDLVYSHTDAGWQLHKSSYRKLRLVSSEVSEQLNCLGFPVEFDEPLNRMQTVVSI